MPHERKMISQLFRSQHTKPGCNLTEIRNHPFLIYLMSEFFQFLIFLCDQGTSNIDGFL